MIRRVIARAHANIALVKYWGKRPGGKHVPATPSISLALDKLVTETTVERIDSGLDRFFLNGVPVDSINLDRLSRYLDLWRQQGLIEGSFSVSSHNHFPTGAGLASSASGFAALATALSRFSPRMISKRERSRLARRGSGSAARSIPGGLAALPLGSDPAARKLLGEEEVPWGMVVAVVESGEKKIGSSAAMEMSRTSSPFYKVWVAQALKDYHRMLQAIKRLDFSEIGRITEANAESMHACMIATRPGLIYWSGTTVELIRAASQWRDDGLETYITVDAGHHAALLGRLNDLDRIAARTAKIKGVNRVIICRPAGEAEVLE